MNLGENIRVALRALGANKLRSALTMLGIIIGVGAVVGLLAIGNGASAVITNQVQGIGSNLVQVVAGRIRQGGQSTQGTLYLSDYNALNRELKNVAGIAPLAQASATVTYERETLSAQVTASTPSFLQVRSYEIERGRFITDADRDRGSRVAVIGSETARQLFGGLNPIGRTIKVNGVQFDVIGLFVTKGGGGFGSADEIIVIPLETGYERLSGSTTVRNGKQTLSGISISASSPDVLDQVKKDLERIIRREHKLRGDDANDFTIFTQAELLSTLGTITTTLQVFLGAIAGISLLVGGIGIMNIMLVSVTERTREIGLRKAVGARQSTILGQFLVETIVLSLVGGTLGIGLGLAIAFGVTVADLIQAEVTWQSIALAFGFSAAVGLFFGIYPAYRASRLRPIEALRYE
jgi:putative ABC transport system permease protein